eukprot:TRINITY_DN1380_c0_g1_i10.p1 TRINITY_DN1380_c0_g1~~TRINITY_DN1380_c0_g1_i10.p1  ORF type:complete len:724 (+),score=165.68 TRINITY_DN1380_c0_g1_i10:219-2174(+)
MSVDKKYFSVIRGDAELVVKNLADGSEFTQSCKSLPNKIEDYFWTHANELFMVTRQGLEIYRLYPELKALKLVKAIQEKYTWFTYSHENRLIVLYAGGNVLNCYHFPPNMIVKVPRVELLEIDKRSSILSSSVSVERIYGSIYCVFIYSEAKQVVLYELAKDEVKRKHILHVGVGSHFSTSVVDNLVVVHILDLKVSGVFDVRAKSVIEQCEAQPATASQAPTPSLSSVLAPLYPMRALVAPSSIAPFLPEQAAAPVSVGGIKDRGQAPGVRLYSESWEFRSPNFIIDRQQAYLWELKLNLNEASLHFLDNTSHTSQNFVQNCATFVINPAASKAAPAHSTQQATVLAQRTMTPLSLLIDFLMRRTLSKNLILQVLRSAVEQRSSLQQLAKIFDLLNVVYSSNAINLTLKFYRDTIQDGSEQKAVPAVRETLDVAEPPLATARRTSTAALPSAPLSVDQRPASAADTSATLLQVPLPQECTPDGHIILDQADLYTHVFCPVDEQKSLDHKFLVALFIEYIRSVLFRGMRVHHYLYEFVINMLVTHKMFPQLHQFLQYHVISDSVHVAYLLLSLEAIYPPSYQLALDMMKRLGLFNEIVEVLLTKGQVMAALRFVRSYRVETISPKRFLDAAEAQSDQTLFYTTYTLLRFFA